MKSWYGSKVKIWPKTKELLGKLSRFLPLVCLIFIVAAVIWSDLHPFFQPGPPQKITAALAIVTGQDVFNLRLDSYETSVQIKSATVLEAINQRLTEHSSIQEDYFHFAVKPGEQLKLQEVYRGHLDPYLLRVVLKDKKGGKKLIPQNLDNSFTFKEEGDFNLWVEQDYSGYLKLLWKAKVQVTTDELQLARINIQRYLAAFGSYDFSRELDRKDLSQWPDVRAILLACQEYGRSGELALWYLLESNSKGSLQELLSVYLFSEISGIGREDNLWQSAREWREEFAHAIKEYEKAVISGTT